MDADGTPDPVRVARSEFATSDRELAADFLRSSYVGDVSIGGGDGFSFAHTATRTARFALNTLWVGIDLGIGTEVLPDDPLLVTQPVSGRIAYVESDYPEGGAPTGGVVLHPPSGPNHAVCEHFDVAMVQLDRDDVGAYAEAMTGLDAGRLAFHELVPRSEELGRAWLATVAHVRDDVLADPWLAEQPILLEQAFRDLTASLLRTFPNTAHDRTTDPEGPSVRGEVPAARLREVADFLDAHAGDPVRPTDVAGLAGVPVDEVAEAMRRRTGRHPAELLWAARLRGVRRDLLAAEPGVGVGVARLAGRWGFPRPGRFRVAYTRYFGETPEQTLRR